MLQDEGKEILRHAAKYLQKSWKTTGDFDDYQAVNLLKWMFTAEPEDMKPGPMPPVENTTIGQFGWQVGGEHLEKWIEEFEVIIHNDAPSVQPRNVSMDRLFDNWNKHDILREELLAKTLL